MDQKHPKMFIKAEGSPTHFLVYIYHIKFSTDVFAWEQLSKTEEQTTSKWLPAMGEGCCERVSLVR